MAGRKPIYKAAMSATQRRQKNDAERLQRGEIRVTAWLTPQAAEALHALMGENGSRATKHDAINEALTGYVQQGGIDASL